MIYLVAGVANFIAALSTHGPASVCFYVATTFYAIAYMKERKKKK